MANERVPVAEDNSIGFVWSFNDPYFYSVYHKILATSLYHQNIIVRTCYYVGLMLLEVLGGPNYVVGVNYSWTTCYGYLNIVLTSGGLNYVYTCKECSSKSIVVHLNLLRFSTVRNTSDFISVKTQSPDRLSIIKYWTPSKR